MGLQSALDELTARLGSLAGAVDALRLTAVEDRPADADDLILDRVAAAVEDRAGWVAEACAEARAGRDALRVHHDPVGTLRRLAACQERVHRLAEGAWTGLLPYETYDELGRLSRARGREWQGWLATMRLGVEACGPPFAAVQTALLAAWCQAAGPAEPPPAPAGSEEPTASLVSAASASSGGSDRRQSADGNSTWRCLP
ncbi:hypothetical protein [Nucisporomicrobium flavum]|uniref:hypothetical protein n=1 Tax=Nucisporomicrobium flavum TaxID=2785915 RepID=UPI0018F76DA2|nr:hypothetical protein [Nucisporomicrobium flavum]